LFISRPRDNDMEQRMDLDLLFPLPDPLEGAEESLAAEQPI